MCPFGSCTHSSQLKMKIGNKGRRGGGGGVGGGGAWSQSDSRKLHSRSRQSQELQMTVLSRCYWFHSTNLHAWNFVLMFHFEQSWKMQTAFHGAMEV